MVELVISGSFSSIFFGGQGFYRNAKEPPGDSLMLTGMRSGIGRSTGLGGEWSSSALRLLPRWLGFYILRTEK